MHIGSTSTQKMRLIKCEHAWGNCLPKSCMRTLRVLFVMRWLRGGGGGGGGWGGGGVAF